MNIKSKILIFQNFTFFLLFNLIFDILYIYIKRKEKNNVKTNSSNNRKAKCRKINTF